MHYSASMGRMLLGTLGSALLAANAATAQGTDFTQIELGRYLTKAADCMACHTAKDGKPWAGGFPVPTPFGTIYSPNITPDPDTGIGKWSSDDFYNAMHFGIRRDGAYLYPAFPFPWYTKMSRSDVDAIKAYLDTVKPVHQENRPSELPWPLGWRAVAARGWQMLFFHPGEYVPLHDKSDLWNRGAYLVEGPGHCAACHTPKNMFGAEKNGRSLAGGDAGDSWFAPSLTSSQPDGIGGWDARDIIQYLRTGANSKTATVGPMTDVIMDSTQYLSDQDLQAMAAYLQDLPQDGKKKTGGSTSGKSPDQSSLSRGQALYVDNCIGCHMAGGEGQKAAFPPLKASPSVQAGKADSIIQVILAGGSMADPSSRPTGLAMPAFAWKFNDAQLADLANYIRNAWGNHASAVSSATVAGVRKDVEKSGSTDQGALSSPY